MLSQHGEFYPFGASLGLDGKISMDEWKAYGKSDKMMKKP